MLEAPASCFSLPVPSKPFHPRERRAQVRVRLDSLPPPPAGVGPPRPLRPQQQVGTHLSTNSLHEIVRNSFGLGALLHKRRQSGLLEFEGFTKLPGQAIPPITLSPWAPTMTAMPLLTKSIREEVSQPFAPSARSAPPRAWPCHSPAWNSPPAPPPGHPRPAPASPSLAPAYLSESRHVPTHPTLQPCRPPALPSFGHSFATPCANLHFRNALPHGSTLSTQARTCTRAHARAHRRVHTPLLACSSLSSDSDAPGIPASLP